MITSFFGSYFGNVAGSRFIGPANHVPIRAKLLLTLRPYAFGEDVLLDDLYGRYGEDVIIEWRGRYGEDVPIMGYMIPEDMQAEMFAVLGEGLWFDAVGTAKQVNNIELSMSPEINQWSMWYRLDYLAGIGKREVYFFNPATLTDADVAVIAAWIKEPGVTPYPTAFFNGFDARLSTYTGGPTYVADNEGVLGSPGSNLPAVQGMRLATTIEDGAVLGPNMLTTTQQQCDGGWTITGESTVSGGVARVLSTTGVLSQIIASGISVVIGKRYSVSYTIVGTPLGALVTADNAVLTALSGFNSVEYVPTTTGFGIKRSGVCDITIDNISLREVIPTYYDTDTSGNPIVASTPQKTVTYNTDWTTKTFAETFDKFDISDPLKAPGWLCEPVRTNYALNSATPATHTTGSLPIGTYTLWQEGTGSIAATAGTAVGTFGTASNGTPATITITTAGTVVLTASGTNTFVQLELGAFKTSRIYTTTASVTRAATIASFPTAGKIPVNDFAIRMIVVPRTVNQTGYVFSSYIDANNYTVVIISSAYIYLRKRIGGVNIDCGKSNSLISGVPIDIIAVKSEYGMQVSYRTYSTSWGLFANGTLNSALDAKSDAPISPTYQIGALNGSAQFTGNISLFDCVPIPTGITDPMAWAKLHWGVA